MAGGVLVEHDQDRAGGGGRGGQELVGDRGVDLAERGALDLFQDREHPPALVGGVGGVGVEAGHAGLLRNVRGPGQDQPQQGGPGAVDVAVGADALQQAGQQVAGRAGAAERGEQQVALAAGGHGLGQVALLPVLGAPPAGGPGQQPQRDYLRAVPPQVGHLMVGEPLADAGLELPERLLEPVAYHDAALVGRQGDRVERVRVRAADGGVAVRLIEFLDELLDLLWFGLVQPGQRVEVGGFAQPPHQDAVRGPVPVRGVGEQRVEGAHGGRAAPVADGDAGQLDLAAPALGGLVDRDQLGVAAPPVAGGDGPGLDRLRDRVEQRCLLPADQADAGSGGELFRSRTTLAQHEMADSRRCAHSPATMTATRSAGLASPGTWRRRWRPAAKNAATARATSSPGALSRQRASRRHSRGGGARFRLVVPGVGGVDGEDVLEGVDQQRGRGALPGPVDVRGR